MRFDPRLELSTTERSAREADIAKAIETALQSSRKPRRGRILRRFVNAVTAAIRTNFYQHDAGGRPKGPHCHQVRKPQGRRHAAAAPL